MARIRLTIQGKLGEISADSFVSVISDSLSILRDLDRKISNRSRGTLQWVVRGLGEGSSYVELETRIIHGDEDFSYRMTKMFSNGITQIQTEGVTPPLFSIDNVKKVYSIVRQLGRDGVEGVNYWIPDINAEVKLTSSAEQQLQGLVGVHHESMGSIEGRIELVSLHKPYKRFNIYHSVTQKAIKCNLPESMERDVISVLEKRRRVIVSGVVSYNAKGEPIRIQITHPLRILKNESELPTVDDILGLSPDITEGLSTEEFIRSLRDG